MAQILADIHSTLNIQLPLYSKNPQLAADPKPRICFFHFFFSCLFCFFFLFVAATYRRIRCGFEVDVDTHLKPLIQIIFKKIRFQEIMIIIARVAGRFWTLRVRCGFSAWRISIRTFPFFSFSSLFLLQSLILFHFFPNLIIFIIFCLFLCLFVCLKIADSLRI